MAKMSCVPLWEKVHLKGTSGRESESLDDDRVSSFDCEGLARADALSIAGLPVLEVEGVEMAVVLQHSMALFGQPQWSFSFSRMRAALIHNRLPSLLL